MHRIQYWNPSKLKHVYETELDLEILDTDTDETLRSDILDCYDDLTEATQQELGNHRTEAIAAQLYRDENGNYPEEACVCFRGRFEEKVDFYWNLLEGQLPEHLRLYFNIDFFMRDTRIDYVELQGPKGDWYFFR